MSQAAAKQEDKRERLLQAAKRCFVARGFHGARMAQIAKEAQMSPGHIYHYFESKEQIIAGLVQTHIEEKLKDLERLEEAGDKVVDVMVENLEKSVDCDDDPFWSTLMLEITAEATRNAEIADILRQADADMKACVIKSLGGHVDQTDLDSRLEVLIAFFQGIGLRNILNPSLNRAEVARLVRDIFEPLLSGKTPR